MKPIFRFACFLFFVVEPTLASQCRAADKANFIVFLADDLGWRDLVWRWLPGNEAHLRASEITIPESRKPLEYQTMHSGKWHLYGYFNNPEQPQPDDHRYDWWFATQNNATPTHKNPMNFVRNRKPVGPVKGFSAPSASESTSECRIRRDLRQKHEVSVFQHQSSEITCST